MKKRTKILEIINLFQSAESFIGNQFSYLRDNGFEMHLICSEHPSLKQFSERHGLQYKAVQLNRGITPLADVKALYRVCRYIQKNKIDIVIAHQAKARLIGTLAAWLYRVPRRIIFAHGVLYETMQGFTRNFFINLDRFVSSLSTEVVCVSNSVKNVRKRDNIDSKNKTIFLLNKGTCGGIDTQSKFNPNLFTLNQIQEAKQKFGVNNCYLTVGFCGRLVNDKGINELISGFKLLLEKHPTKRIKLLFIGNREYRDSISKDTIDYIENNANIVFTGYVNYSDIPIMYLLMDVLILPSYREGFPTVVLEAGAMNTPSIVSKSIGCIDSIQNNHTGIYCNIEPHDICAKMELFMNPEFRATFSQTRNYIVKNFDHSVVWPEILQILKNG